MFLRFFIILFIGGCANWLFGQGISSGGDAVVDVSKNVPVRELLQSGPMVGYATFREVMLWVQTTSEAKVQFKYWEQDKPQKKYTTDVIQTTKSQAFTAKLLADSVQPGRFYNYQLLINNTAVSLSYPLRFQTPALERTTPLKVALGSCNYVNDTVYEDSAKYKGGNYEIFTSIYDKKPDIMLWGGDNVYTRDVDWGSRTGFFYRYTHTRSMQQIQPLIASVSNYAVWDDHDYGSGDGNRAYPYKHLGLEAFKLFWANPTVGIENNGGITSHFEWADTEFFLMDNRSFRTDKNLKTAEKTILGEVQIRWLIENLKNSRATFKFVVMGGQFLTSATEKENYINYPKERDSILKYIDLEDIKGVIFLTGDRHFTELSKYQPNGTYPIYDLTVSPLTSNIHREAALKEINQFRLENTLVAERNFCILDVSGNQKDRILKITIYNTTGKELWTKLITANELYTKSKN